jgi:branched-chain amino acid transport system permease protein
MPLYVASLLVDGLIIGGIYVLLALGLTLTFGVMQIMNFAYGAILMWAAFITYALIVHAGLGFSASLAIALLTVALGGVLLERLAFRRVRYDLLNALIVSMGLIAILENVAVAVWGTDPRSIPSPFSGIVRIGWIQFGQDRLVALVSSILLAGGLSLFLKVTRTGRAIRAAAQNPEVAEAVGINLDRVVAVVFGVSCALAGAAGALYGVIFTVTPVMGGVPLMKGVVVVVLGGLGSVEGAILAGFLLGVAESLGGGLISPILKDGFGLVVLIGVLLWRPSGILGWNLKRF